MSKQYLIEVGVVSWGLESHQDTILPTTENFFSHPQIQLSFRLKKLAFYCFIKKVRSY